MNAIVHYWRLISNGTGGGTGDGTGGGLASGWWLVVDAIESIGLEQIINVLDIMGVSAHELIAEIASIPDVARQVTEDRKQLATVIDIDLVVNGVDDGT